MKKGFTLAEVLITLGIIGVVAALTIPTLINSYQKQTYVTQLKKAYTQFNEALKLMSADKGCVNNLKCTDLFAAGTDNQSLGDEIVKYFKVVKNCEVTPQGCLANSGSHNWDGSDTDYTTDDNYSGYYEFITADGTAFAISNNGSDCDGTGASSGRTGNLNQFCGSLAIDVNGPIKGPNTFGRDIFEFYITNGKGAILYPQGGMDDVTTWKNPDTGDLIFCDESVGDKNGQYCAGRVMEENWQMNY